MKTKLLIFCLLPLIASSCKKEKEPDPPGIMIDKPFKGQSLKVGESFLVAGTASDASGIKSIQVKLLDADLNNPWVLMNRQYDGLQKVDFSFDCIVEDRLLESGDFWVRVRVYNQQSSYAQEFVEVHVNELEKKLEKLLVITDEYQGDVKVYEQDPDADINKKLLLSHPGNMLFSALSSRYQQFYLGVESGQQELKAYELEGFGNHFSLFVSMPYPFYFCHD
ncbi:MAG: hypothetical protein U5Q03_03055 [Bacteroidota bacterium]|nr:hypothetical protein [Bacteroidota bacterium]